MITKAVFKKLRQKQAQQTQIPNPKGGGEIQLTEDTELDYLIISCTADNEMYLVKDPRGISVIIFNLVK